jgi:hypothetical protein
MMKTQQGKIPSSDSIRETFKAALRYFGPLDALTIHEKMLMRGLDIPLHKVEAASQELLQSGEVIEAVGFVRRTFKIVSQDEPKSRKAWTS